VKKLLVVSLLVILILASSFSIPDTKADTLRATKTTILPNPATTTIGVPTTFYAKVLDSDSGRIENIDSKVTNESMPISMNYF